MPWVPSAWRGRRPAGGQRRARAGEGRGLGATTDGLAAPAPSASTRVTGHGAAPGRELAGNQSTYPSPTSRKCKPGPGLRRSPVWGAGLAQLREQEGGPEDACAPGRTFRRTSRPWFTTLC